MMMIALLLLAADSPPLQTSVPGPSFAVPPEMAPHLMAYISCVDNRVRADPRMPAAIPVARQVQADARVGCADVRKSVAKASERALANSAAYGGKKKRRDTVEAVLRAFEGASDRLLDAMSSLPNPNAVRPKLPDQSEN